MTDVFLAVDTANMRLHIDLEYFGVFGIKPGQDSNDPQQKWCVALLNQLGAPLLQPGLGRLPVLDLGAKCGAFEHVTVFCKQPRRLVFQPRQRFLLQITCGLQHQKVPKQGMILIAGRVSRE